MQRRLGTLVALGVGACGSVAGTPDGHPIDASIDSTQPRCSQPAPFGAPTLVPGANLNTANDEYNAELTPDRLAIFFVRNFGNGDIYIASRTSPTGDFEPAIPLPGINGATSGEFHPTVSPDLLTLYFTSNQSGSNAGGFDVFVATRGNVAANFSAPVPVVAVSTADTERGTYLLPDLSALYFSRYPAAGGTEVIYRAPIGPGGIQAPVAVPLGTFTGAGLPVMAANELTIYVASGGDIWKATRAAKTDNFGEPAKVTELDSDTTNEEPSWVSGDGCDLYFASNRAGATGADLYVAHRGS